MTSAPYVLAAVVVLVIAVLVVAAVRLMDRQMRHALPHTVTVRRRGTDDVCQMRPCGNYGAAVHQKIALMRDWDRHVYDFEIKPTGGAR